MGELLLATLRKPSEGLGGIGGRVTIGKQI